MEEMGLAVWKHDMSKVGNTQAHPQLININEDVMLTYADVC
jgi:hypothetical protein